MSASSTVLEDSSKLSFADRTFFRFETVLTVISGLVIFVLVFMASANVLGRWLFNMPIDGYVDWVEQAMAFFAFLGLAYTQRMGGHIRMDMLIGHLKGRLLWASELVSVVLMLMVTLALIYGSYLHFYRAYTIGDSSLDIDLPTWPAKLVVPVALTIFALRLLLQIWGYARAVREGGENPIGVPLIEDAATVAAKEAESVMGSLEQEERSQ